MSKSKYRVCPRCEGEGYVGTLGAYTQDEFAESFEDYDEYVEMHEASKQQCECCKGMRVVTREQLAEYDDMIEDMRMRQAESGYFYGY